MGKAFKGTDLNMSCRGLKYDFGLVYCKNIDGSVYSIPENEFDRHRLIRPDTELKLCSNKGFHYCSKLEDVFPHYSDDGKNRFFEIEVLGNYNEDADKGITKAFRFVREITREELIQADLNNKLNIDLIQKFVTDFPKAIIGGSLGLFLAGARLKRVVESGIGDIDIIMPYYVDISSKDYIEECEDYTSGADFDTSYLIGGTKLDVVIDPKRKYKDITYNGFTYKVADYRQTILAKLNYSIKGSRKHTEDLNELILGIKVESQLPF